MFGFTINASAICTQASKCLKKFPVGTEFLRFYQSHQVNEKSLTRAVIVIHGALRNGDEYFEHMVQTAQKRNVLKTTLILVPHFRKVTDQRLENELYWERRWYQKWKYGYESESGEKISSFELMDQFIMNLTSRFPRIKEIVLTGHSAGGNSFKDMPLRPALIKI